MREHKAVKTRKKLPTINMKNTARLSPLISVNKKDDNNFVYLQKEDDEVIIETDRGALDLLVHKVSEELKK